MCLGEDRGGKEGWLAVAAAASGEGGGVRWGWRCAPGSKTEKEGRRDRVGERKDGGNEG